MAFWKGAGTESKSGDPLFREIVESAGTMVLAIAPDGTILHMNPAAERLLGYNASELVGRKRTEEILAPEEAQRIIGEVLHLVGSPVRPNLSIDERAAATVQAMDMLPPSQVPSFETHCRRKDGSTFPVTGHISALRDSSGAIRGLVAVALDQTATLRQQQATRESQERYRDLFENSNEMIATLSPSGKFLYANPAWKQSFGLELDALLKLDSFEQVFNSDCREDVAALFQEALHGTTVERAILRNPTEDGQVLELELSLSRRRKADSPLAVRCLLSNVTQQKLREHRLALQLAASQIVSENSSADAAAERILEALCTAHRWDFGVLWEIDEAEGRLVFSSAWGTPSLHTDSMMRQRMGAQVEAGNALAGNAWRKGRAVWIRNLAEVQPKSQPNSRPNSQSDTQPDPLIEGALRCGMASGWAVPVRAGNSIVAVLEFYSRLRLREDSGALDSVETVAAPLGQMLARRRERGRTEELSRRQEILLNAVADGICGLDRSGSVTFANPAAERLLGASVANLEGRPMHDLLHPCEDCGLECPLRMALQSAENRTGETTMLHVDGTSLPIEYGFTPIFDHERFSGSVLSFRDISQRYALDRMKDEFVATAGHELRTPLTSIRGALGLLSSGALGQMDEKAASLLRIALNNSERLIRLVNDILDLERIQHGRGPEAFEPVPLARVVDEAVRGVQTVADSAGIQLIHDTVQAQVAGDADQLLQVMTNLLANAIKFSPSGATVSVMMRPEEDGVTISVIDQGRGIPAEMLENIFGRFTQVDASDARQKGGSGLGLAICRTIVTQHGGRIWAERNPVRGSTFRVYLPFRQESAAGDAEPVAARHNI